jgi:hypothetical protein
MFPRRELLRHIAAGLTATTGAVTAIGIMPGQVTGRAGSPLAPQLRASDYLPKYYAEAARSLHQFDDLVAAGKSPESAEARKAFTDAAGAICEGLSRLAGDQAGGANGDSQFWAALGDQKDRIRQNAPEIARLLNNLGEFLPQEEKILLAAKIPPGQVQGLVSDLALALGRFSAPPTSFDIENLKSRVRQSRDAVCDAYKPAGKSRTPWEYSAVALDALDVLGGALTIYANAITSAELIVSLASYTCGISGIIHGSSGIISKFRRA